MKIQINNKQNVFFCSDPHYGHSGIVMGTSKWDDKSGCRPFQTVEDHDRTLVNNINKTVGENDILFCLGDWSFGAYKTGENVTNIRKFREQLKCKNIHLTFGNHDSEIVSNKDNTRDLFSSTAHYREITIIEQPLNQKEKAKKQNIVLSHYSHRVWNNMQSGAWMLFGHCIDEQTELLTDRGWLYRKDLSKDDMCFSFNKSSGISSFKEIKNIFDYEYSGKMYSFKGKNVDFRATEKHRHLSIVPYTDNIEFTTSDELLNKQRWIKNNGISIQNDIDLTNNLLKLLVWINADGSFCSKTLIRFHLKKERKIKRLTELLKELNIKYSYNKTKTDSIKINFTIPEKLKEYRFKPLDEKLLDMSKRQVDIFLTEYEATDGYRTSKNALQIYSCKEAEIDLIQTICVKNGICCNKTKIIRGDYLGWIASINFNREHSHINFKNKISIENVVNEKVWCIETEFSNFLIRRAGKVHFTGNSHGNIKEVQGKTMDVGFDTHNLKPYSYSEIKEIMSGKETVLIDHH